MKRTHNEAIELFIQGKVDAAWEVAKQDEGLSPCATKEAWIDFATKSVGNQNACDKAYEESF